jgi:hypothetical protein
MPQVERGGASALADNLGDLFGRELGRIALTLPERAAIEIEEKIAFGIKDW